MTRTWLMGWFIFGIYTQYWSLVWNIFLLFHILGIILPFDKYFSEGLKPPTRISVLRGKMVIKPQILRAPYSSCRPALLPIVAI